MFQDNCNSTRLKAVLREFLEIVRALSQPTSNDRSSTVQIHELTLLRLAHLPMAFLPVKCACHEPDCFMQQNALYCLLQSTSSRMMFYCNENSRSRNKNSRNDGIPLQISLLCYPTANVKYVLYMNFHGYKFSLSLKATTKQQS